MPRQARIDAPGVLQHILVRGIERRKLFEDDADRKAFVERLGRLLTVSGTPCYAWTLMPTHVHLLLQTGTVPVATLMRRLLTGYAFTFNRRHRRHGPLFQNRYIKRDVMRDVLTNLTNVFERERLRVSLSANKAGR